MKKTVEQKAKELFIEDIDILWNRIEPMQTIREEYETKAEKLFKIYEEDQRRLDTIFKEVMYSEKLQN